MSFSGDLAKFAEKAGVSMDTVVKKVVVEVGNSLVRMTPVDTGRARANWNISENAPDASTNFQVDPAGMATMGKIASYNVQAGGVYVISNSLPYIERLEHGWSKKAPAGMVRVTAARFQHFVKTVGV